MKKILKKHWFTPRTGKLIGIILYENALQEKRCYIATVQGKDEQADIEHIISNGAKFPVELAEIL